MGRQSGPENSARAFSQPLCGVGENAQPSWMRKGPMAFERKGLYDDIMLFSSERSLYARSVLCRWNFQ